MRRKRDHDWKRRTWVAYCTIYGVEQSFAIKAMAFIYVVLTCLVTALRIQVLRAFTTASIALATC